MTIAEPVTLAFSEGFKAFSDDAPCRYAYGTPDYWAWWRGWEVAAGHYLDDVLSEAWGHDH